MSDLLDILQNGKYSLNINGKSKHFNSLHQLNEDNPGFGITAEKGNSFITAGGYENSYFDPSFYAGIGYKNRFGNQFYIEPGIIAGLVTGYKDSLSPMILPMVSIGHSKLGALNLMYAPEYQENPATLMMNLSFPF
jgi:hypothetical protein